MDNNWPVEQLTGTNQYALSFSNVNIKCKLKEGRMTIKLLLIQPMGDKREAKKKDSNSKFQTWPPCRVEHSQIKSLWNTQDTNKIGNTRKLALAQKRAKNKKIKIRGNFNRNPIFFYRQYTSQDCT